MKQQIIRFAAVAAMATGMVFAQTPSPSGNARPGIHNFMHQRLARAAQELNLTDAQKQQARTIFQQARQTAQPVRDQLKQNRQALTAAVKSGSDVQALSQTQGSLMGQLTAIRSNAMSQFYAILTAEQKAKADQMHQQMQQRFQNRHNRNTNG